MQTTLQARVKFLSHLGGLNGTEKTVLNSVANRVNQGLSISPGDTQCITVMWEKHGSSVPIQNERVRKPRLRASNNG